ncbi:MAG: proton-conducting transporter membrane subunit [Pseudomonadales bacterium]
MSHHWLHTLAIETPIIFLGLALLFGRQPYRWPDAVAFLPAICALATVGAYAWAGGSSADIAHGYMAEVHLDPLSLTLLLLISTIGGVVMVFSRQYLRGDPRHGEFMCQLALIFAAVSTLAIAGNLYLMMLAWVAMSLCLHQLLKFRTERPGAQIAARKKYFLARFGDLSLVLAFGILIDTLGTADLHEILELLRAADGSENQLALGLAAGLIAVTAILKSAQFPVHGWLVEVMETPTPVSAVLHAGVVNAGGFLFLRFSELMTLTPSVSWAVAGIGIVTAIVGAAMMLAQPTIKGSLAYSTVAQMGFMMAQCGLGAYTAALVHLVGHSLYKAYAFLSSGDAVADARKYRWAEVRGSRLELSGGILLGTMLTLYAAIGWLFGVTWQSMPVATTLGAIFVMGTWLLAGNGQPTRQITGYLVIAMAACSAVYFGVQKGATVLFANVFATSPEPTVAVHALLAALLLGCLALIVTQGRGRGLQGTRLANLQHHLSQGLYINLIANRSLNAYRTSRTNAV